MSKTPRVDVERKYFNSDQRRWTHEQESIYNLAEILEMELIEAKNNLMKCGYDELNKVCNQRDEARAKLDEARKLLATRVEASRLSEANLEIKQLRTDLETVNNARETVRRDYHRAIDECAELRAELEIAKGNTITAQDENSRLQTIIENNEESKKWENLYDELFNEIMFENERDSYGPTETAPECIKRIIKERDELKTKLELAQKHNWDNMVCIHHTDIERAASIGNCPVCEANNANKLSNELSQSESNFSHLLKSNGKTIDENAKLKFENDTLQDYLNQLNSRMSKIENDVKDLKIK